VSEEARNTDAMAETVVSVPGGKSERPPPEDDLTGAPLDHFVVGVRLGRGGMGAVYAAHDTSLDRQVAIKVVRDDVHLENDQVERFLREARAQAKLNHPNIVHIYYIGRRQTRGRDDSLFFAMEHVRGGDLDAILKSKERMEPELARTAMIQVAQGLRAAARAGVIHRDIKPSNLMRTEEGTLKIADFGLAKPLDGDVQITQRGALVGSPWYMAPEQILGEEIDFRADMYSLGACFFHLLAGKPAYDGPRPMAVVTRHLNDPIPHLPRDVPSSIDRVVRRLLAKKAEDRYRNYDDLIADLEAAAPTRRSYAALATRAAAAVVDFIVAAVLIGVLSWPGLILYFVLVTLGHAWRGQTPGKYLLQIHVRRDDGSSLGIWRSLMRTLAAMWMPLVTGATIGLSAGLPELIMTIEKLRPQSLGNLETFLVAMAISHGLLTLLWLGGLLLAGFHPKRKTVHDLLVGSVVTYRLEPEQRAPTKEQRVSAPRVEADRSEHPTRVE
jgi:uncharacterized RDD family membrane protein YckC